MTPKQQEIYNFIEQYQIDFGKSPTFAEIQKHFNFGSLNSVFKHITALEKKGHIKRNHEARGIELLDSVKNKLFSEEEVQENTLPLFGSIPAGTPSSADSHVVDHISVSDYLVKDSGNTFLLKVSGDSVDKSGIWDGDIVIVDKLKTPRAEDIVVALVDGENTLKKYTKDKMGTYHLCPFSTNPVHEEIIPRHEALIQGVVVGSMRKY